MSPPNLPLIGPGALAQQASRAAPAESTGQPLVAPDYTPQQLSALYQDVQTLRQRGRSTAQLNRLLQRHTAAAPSPITSVTDLARRLGTADTRVDEAVDAREAANRPVVGMARELATAASLGTNRLFERLFYGAPVVQKEDQARGAFQQAHPFLAAGANVGGSLLPTMGILSASPGLLGATPGVARLGTGGQIGAFGGAGALQSFNESSGAPGSGQSIRDAALGGLLGMGAGAIGARPAAEQAVDAARSIMQRVPAEEAVNAPTQLAGLQNNLQGIGSTLKAVPGDVLPNVYQASVYARNVVNPEARVAMVARNAQMGRDLATIVDEVRGTPYLTPTQATKQAVAQRSEFVRPIYRMLEEQGGTAEPSFTQRALEEVARHQDKVGDAAVTGPAMRTAEELTGPDRGRSLALLQQTLDRAGDLGERAWRNAINVSRYHGYDLGDVVDFTPGVGLMPGRFTVKPNAAPNWLTLQTIERGLRETGQAAFQTGGADARGRILDIANELRDGMDKLYPGNQNARELWRYWTSGKEGVPRGQGWWEQLPADNKDWWQNASPVGQERARQQALSGLVDAINRRADPEDPFRFLRNEQTRQNLRLVTSPAEFARIQRWGELESALRGTERITAKNSITEPLATAREEFGMRPQGPAPSFGRPTYAFERMGARLTNVRLPNPDAARVTLGGPLLARLMSSSNPEDIAQVWGLLGRQSRGPLGLFARGRQAAKLTGLLGLGATRELPTQ